MKQYLIDFFRYNDWANRQVLGKIHGLPRPDKAARFFSHLINSQNKWMARIKGDERARTMSWFDPLYPLDQLEEIWAESLGIWLNFLERLPAERLETEVHYITDEGDQYSSLLREIALQLNYHSIHHRAQISLLIRQQNIEPPFIDYIGYVRKRE